MSYNNDFASVPKASENVYRDQSSRADDASMKSKGNREKNDEDNKNNVIAKKGAAEAGKKGAAEVGKQAMTAGLRGILKSIFSAVLNVAKTALSFLAKAPIVASAIAIGVISLVTGLISAVSGVVSEITPVIDTVSEKPIAYVRSAATGNSDYEDLFYGFCAEREMARRIWTVFGGFKVMTDPDKPDDVEPSAVTVPSDDISEAVDQVTDINTNKEHVDSYKSAIDGTAVKNKICYGLRPEQLCAVLGNWTIESGLDPTAVETVYDEPFRIGPVKQRAMMSDFITKFGWSKAKKDGVLYFDEHDTEHHLF